ncbi:MAG: cysteine--tRNA ligase [Micrococcales bacterium]|nr:cysteine--tRNA ligase [Actinomycetota bacterium]NCA08038.1 cysteine--tRNA ligase [Micrococcales bacterium]
MALELFDSKTQELRPFTPLTAGHVEMYVCGPTVQSAPHLGHLRSALVYDILRRWLIATNHTVTMVRNVTDIDDKVLVNAGSRDWIEFAREVELTFDEAYLALNILEPTHKPHATEHIADMIELTKKLIQLGHAYQATDGSANVFFDTTSWPEYGELTNQKLENMEGESDVTFGRKSPNDFALFKAHKSDEPETAAWETPWGKARPGWHIECSAMAKYFLGESFDIHGGGLDLRFPHHENELAQSRAAGDQFANFWTHNALVTINGNKMSKSLGNGVSVKDLEQAGSWGAIRYWLSSAQYRSNLDYSESSIRDAQAALDRITGFLKRTTNVKVIEIDYAKLPQAFTDAMNADLNVPGALAVLHDVVRAGNTAFDASDTEKLLDSVEQVKAMIHVLGLTFVYQEPVISEELQRQVEELLTKRQEAKLAKDFALADQIRAEIEDLGVTLKDMKDQTMWSFNG